MSEMTWKESIYWWCLALLIFVIAKYATWFAVGIILTLEICTFFNRLESKENEK